MEKVFDFCADPRKSWYVGPDAVGRELGEVKMTKDGVGTHYTWAMKVAGLRIEVSDGHTEYVRGSFAQVAEGGRAPGGGSDGGRRRPGRSSRAGRLPAPAGGRAARPEPHVAERPRR